jgi:Ca2+-dependent lipid-binding protein
MGGNVCGITTDPIYTVPVLVRHATVTVQLISAKHLMNRDLFKKSDPYVFFQLGQETFTSKTVDDTLNPLWNQTATLKWDGHSPLLLTVFDSDFLLKDSEFFILHCYIFFCRYINSPFMLTLSSCSR